MRDRVFFFLNGERQEVGGARAGWMLADYLRRERALTGTKIVCAEGDCGACTVLRYFPLNSAQFVPINACITTVAQMDGSALVTVDRLAETHALTPVQCAMRDAHASQCGFCTPGIVMALTGLVEERLRDGRPITERSAKNALTGNLCRCTGYEPIISAALAIDLNQCESLEERFLTPRVRRELRAVVSEPLRIRSEEFRFWAPLNVREAVAHLKRTKLARPIAAGTDLGVVHNKRKLRLNEVVSLHLVRELYALKVAGTRVRVGARVTLADLREALKGRIPEFARYLDLFASPQIKNSATLVGNLCNASPIADTPPFLLVAGAIVHVAGARGGRRVAIEDFFLGYRKTALRAGELVTAVEFEVPTKTERLALYKVSQRKDLDIASVNAAFRARWNRAGTGLLDVRIAMGGVAATPIRLPKTERALRVARLDADARAGALRALESEMSPLSDLRGSAAFRRVIAENLVRRFLMEHLDRAPR